MSARTGGLHPSIHPFICSSVCHHKAVLLATVTHVSWGAVKHSETPLLCTQHCFIHLKRDRGSERRTEKEGEGGREREGQRDGGGERDREGEGGSDGGMYLLCKCRSLQSSETWCRVRAHTHVQGEQQTHALHGYTHVHTLTRAQRHTRAQAQREGARFCVYRSARKRERETERDCIQQSATVIHSTESAPYRLRVEQSPPRPPPAQ